MSNPGLYIHIPFCRAKCPYCDFYSVSDTSLREEFLTAIEAEAALYSDSFCQFDSLYVGGGTPTVLSPQQISTLLKGIRQIFRFNQHAEITIEANPADITEQYAENLLELGFNRISLGVQSFCNNDLRVLGRHHTRDTALNAIDILRKKGVKNLSLDLIYAVPAQTVSSWQDTLNTAATLAPEHLSCYQLTLRRNTVFFNRCKETDKRFASETAQKKFFLSTVEFVAKKGYSHYEISNFAARENLKAYHNEKYWNHSPYLGLGPSAHSFCENRRWWNRRCVGSYIACLKQGVLPVAGQEILKPQQIALESLFLGFRTANGFDIRILESFNNAAGVLDRMVKQKLAEIRQNRVLPTLKGMLFADGIPGLFLSN